MTDSVAYFFPWLQSELIAPTSMNTTVITIGPKLRHGLDGPRQCGSQLAEEWRPDMGQFPRTVDCSGAYKCLIMARLVRKVAAK